MTKLLCTIQQLVETEAVQTPVVNQFSEANPRIQLTVASKSLGSHAGTAGADGNPGEEGRDPPAFSKNGKTETTQQAPVVGQFDSQRSSSTMLGSVLVPAHSNDDARQVPSGNKLPPHARGRSKIEVVSVGIKTKHDPRAERSHVAPTAGNVSDATTSSAAGTEGHLEKGLSKLAVSVDEPQNNLSTTYVDEFTTKAFEQQFKKSSTPYSTGETRLPQSASALPAEAVPLPDDLEKHYAYGSRIMMKMGWAPGSGLGARGTGMRDPINPRDSAEDDVGSDYSGIGFKQRRGQTDIRDHRTTLNDIRSIRKGNAGSALNGLKDDPLLRVETSKAAWNQLSANPEAHDNAIRESRRKEPLAHFVLQQSREFQNNSARNSQSTQASGQASQSTHAHCEHTPLRSQTLHPTQNQ